MKKYFLIFLIAVVSSAFSVSSHAGEKGNGKPAISRVANKSQKKHHHAHKQAKHKGKRAKKSKAS